MFSDGDDVFSYAQYLALFVGRVLWEGGENVKLFFVLSLYICKEHYKSFMWLLFSTLHGTSSKRLKAWTQTIRSSRGQEKKPKAYVIVCFLKSLLINIMILYSISIHTWFDWDSFKMSICSSFCLSVDLKVCLGDAGAERQHISAGIFMTWLGNTVSGHDSQSSLTGFVLSRSVLKAMAPVWNMASIPSESVKSSLASSSHSILSPQTPSL